MTESSPEFARKLQRMMLLRVGLITLFLGSNLVLSARDADPFSSFEQQMLLWLIAATYGLTIAYALLLERLRGYLERFALVQIAVDLALVRLVVEMTGGGESHFTFLYVLVALAGAILLGRRGARVALGLSVLLILSTVVPEIAGWRGPLPEARTITALQTGIVHISAVFLVAVLGGYLTEQLRTAGQRLEYTSADLQTARALNENIVVSIPSGLIGYGLDGRVIFFNPSAERITGIESATALGQRLSDLLPSLAEQPDRPASIRWEARFRTPAGEARTLGLARSALMDGSGAQVGWLVIFRDLSRVRQLEMRIRRSEKFAAIGRMAAGIAHEIRNPLASMSGSIQMMRGGDADPMQARLMDIVLREIDRLNQLISDFLQFARPSPPDLREVDLAELLAEVQTMFDNRGEAARLVIEVDEPCGVWADPARLRQVVWNLLLNAADAMPQSGQITIRAERREDDVRIAVQDDGVGMAPDVIEHIFDPFYTTKPEGTGLGLAQVHRIVEEHAGTLEVDSRPDVGTTFTVVLPAEAT